MSPSFPWLTVIVLGVMAAIAYRCGHNRGRLVQMEADNEEFRRQLDKLNLKPAIIPLSAYPVWPEAKNPEQKETEGTK